MNKFSLYIILITIGISGGQLIDAQTDSTDHYNKNLYELSQLYITSEKKSKQKLNTSSATIRVINQEKIKSKGYFTLDEALSDLPGFQFRNILGLNSYSFLRGLPRQNNSILVLIDGIQINELNSGGFYGGGQYNLSNVERIEVIYGPASVIYGTNAISGIINIITKVPEQTSSLTAQTAIGSYNTYLSDLTYSHAGKKTLIQLSGMYKSSEKADLTNENNDNNWNDELEIYETDYAFDAKLKYNDFLVGLNYQNRRSSTSTHHPSVGTVHKGFGSLWNLQLINAYLIHDKKISENLALHTTVFNRNATILGNSVKEVTDTGQIAYFRPNNQIGIESTIEIDVHKNLSLISGIFGHYESLADGYSKTYSEEYFLKPQKPDSPEKRNNSLMGIFLQVDYNFFKYWYFTPGLRFEYNTSYKQVLIPRASLIFNKNKINSKLIYGKAFRAPKPWDFTSGVGNPDLKPEYFNSVELSNTFFITNSFKTEFCIYNNNLQNGIVKVNTTDNNSYYWNNSGKTATTGLEFNTSCAINKLNTQLSYSYNHSINSFDEVVEEIAPHMGFFGVDYYISSYLNIGLSGNYIGKRKNTKEIKATNSEYIKSAVVFNLYLNVFDYKNLSINFIIKNLTNTEYYHTSNLNPDRYRQPQRSFFIQLSYKIKNI
jgi:outer membrane receptor for ferrienterochelin and colicins